MEIKLHKLARTTPATRAQIQLSDRPVAELAQELGVSEDTVRKWKKRSDTHDRSHVRHNLGASTTDIEEGLIYGLRCDVGLSLDDTVEVMRRCINTNLSRSAIYRCMKRQGIASGPALPKPDKQKFEQTTCGFIHIDLKHLPAMDKQKQYACVAIDRETRYVYMEILEGRSAHTLQDFLERFIKHFPHRIHTILTDNGSEFTDRFAIDKKNKPKGKPSGRHLFDLVCKKHGIEHRLIKPFTPQTNGMVERFNRRLAERLAMARRYSKHRTFESREKRAEYLIDFVYNYNRTRLKCLDYRTPLQILGNQTEVYNQVRDYEQVGFSW